MYVKESNAVGAAMISGSIFVPSKRKGDLELLLPPRHQRPYSPHHIKCGKKKNPMREVCIRRQRKSLVNACLEGRLGVHRPLDLVSLLSLAGRFASEPVAFTVAWRIGSLAPLLRGLGLAGRSVRGRGIGGGPLVNLDTEVVVAVDHFLPLLDLFGAVSLLDWHGGGGLKVV
jgi:hypothetical protein